MNELTESTENTDLTVVATSLDELIEAHPIVEGRVAPMRVLDAEGARIMHLTFDTGQELREHTAPVPILLQAIAGEFTIDAAARRVELAPGGILHLAAGVPHAVTVTGPSRLLIVMLAAPKADAAPQ